MSQVPGAWERFFFEPQSTAPLALVRIGVGLLSFAWAVSLAPDLSTFFSADGVLPKQPPDQGTGVWGILGLFESDRALIGTYVLLLIASVTLTLGLFTRISSFVVLVALIAFARRDSTVFNSGDGLIRNLVLLTALAPAGASLSLDRLRRTRDRFWEFPKRAPWALRLIQIQVSLLYLSTVYQKTRGTDWGDGTAVSYALRVKDIERFPLPDGITHSVDLAHLTTYGTLMVELALGVLIWVPKLRPWVLVAGVGMHLTIDYSIRVGFFSYAIFVSYLAFVTPGAAEWVILRARDAVRAIRKRVPDAVSSRGPLAGERTNR